MTEPSTNEIRDALVAWAHAEGYLAVQLPASHDKRWQVIVDARDAVTLSTNYPTRNVSAHTDDYDAVLVWMLAVVSGLVADIGACSWCGGDVMVDSGGVTPWGESIGVRCSACASKPGREVMDAAELVCWSISGSPEAREHLLAFADRWQGDGEPLGSAVAHWLAGVSEWRRAALDVVQAATLPCPKCEGVGALVAARIGARIRCDCCEGFGRVARKTG